jgi:1,2-diacylglycerol 3-alpha-glucosyltransferase
MKISSCQFNDSYFPIMDGVGMVAHNYALWMNTKYGKASLVTSKAAGYIDSADYEVIRFKSLVLLGLKPYRLGIPSFDFEFKRKLDRNHFTILHTHCPFISGRVALRLAQKDHIPLVTTFHSKYREDFKKTVKRQIFIDLMMKYIIDFYNKIDYVWVPNHSTGKTLKEYGFTGNYEIMPNGTDLRIPSDSGLVQMKMNGLKAIGADDHEFVLLFVGQHRWEKNVRTIIDSLRIIKSSAESFKMVFVGEGYAAKDMKRLVNKYELSGNVLFTGVIRERDKLEEIYACTDLFLFPSIYDTSGMVMGEAATFAVPSIVVRNSSVAEDVYDGINGFLISNSAVALAKKIIELKQNPEAIRKAGEGARKSIYRPWESIVDQVFNRYEEIIKDYSSNNKGK